MKTTSREIITYPLSELCFVDPQHQDEQIAVIRSDGTVWLKNDFCKDEVSTQLWDMLLGLNPLSLRAQLEETQGYIKDFIDGKLTINDLKFLTLEKF